MQMYVPCFMMCPNLLSVADCEGLKNLARMYVCMYIYIYVCVCIYVYINMYVAPCISDQIDLG